MPSYVLTSPPPFSLQAISCSTSAGSSGVPCSYRTLWICEAPSCSLFPAAFALPTCAPLHPTLFKALSSSASLTALCIVRPACGRPLDPHSAPVPCSMLIPPHTSAALLPSPPPPTPAIPQGLKQLLSTCCLPPSHFPVPLLWPSLAPLDAVQTHSPDLTTSVLSFPLSCRQCHALYERLRPKALAAALPPPHLFSHHKGPTAWLFSIATSSPAQTLPIHETTSVLPLPFLLPAMACRTGAQCCMPSDAACHHHHQRSKP